MHAIRILLWRELRAIAFAPSSHLVAAVYMLLQGITFVFALRPFAEAAQERSLVDAFFQGAMFWIPYFSLFPLLTMRLFAEEQKLGTMEMLLTAPVRIREVVIAKFLAVAVFYAVLWLPTVIAFHIYPFIIGQDALHQTDAFWCAMALVFTMGLMNLGFGCLASSMTTSQIAAGILTFGLLMLHFLLAYLPSRLGELSAPVQKFFSYIHSDAHLRDAAGGLWDSRPLGYYVSSALLLLAATGYALNSRRWKS